MNASQETFGSTSSYDEVPYPSGPIPRSHPGNLATIAALFGMQPAAPNQCRVLELGCASGGNLIPMAQDLPGSWFQGIDASVRQVRAGQAVIKELGLANLQLAHGDILHFSHQGPPFDYIICHGVYSWVPVEVQNRILEIGRAMLGPQGVLYVSYNTLPGWYLRGVVRDMMRYHASLFDRPAERIQQSRLLLKFLVESAATSQESYRQLLKDEADLLARCDDSYLYHEHLEDVNAPCYFHEFVDRAAAAGLQYLGESCFSAMLTANFGPEVERLLQGAPLLRQEQYMDFLRNRTFRETLLCHREVSLQREISSEILSTRFVRLEQRLALGDWDPCEAGEVTVPVDGGQLNVSAPITKTALRILNECWPAFLQVDELFQKGVEQLRRGPTPLADNASSPLRGRLQLDLMALYARNLVAVRTDPPAYQKTSGERPRSPPLARVQARSDDRVTTRLHTRITLPALCRVVLLALDGEHDRPALREHVRASVRRGELQVRRGEELLNDPDDPTLDAMVSTAIAQLGEAALLIG